MRTLDHENVLKLHEVYESGKYIHLVLEFLSGGELLEKIKNKGNYKESDARFVMK